MTRSFFSTSPTSPSPRSNLPRGKACMSCRRRKIKCDGRKPVCSQCLRSPGTADDCEYPLEGRSRTQQLEETIKKLQTRIGELEASANDQSSILLHEPYDGTDSASSFVGLDIPPYTESWSSQPVIDIHVSPSPTSRVNTPTSASSSSTLVLEEPPPDMMERLVDTFLNNFTHVGFFLDPSSFRQSALLPFQFGHYDRPSPALLSVVYMWGSRLSHAPRHTVYNEDAFLVCTLQNIHQDLGGNHPHRVIHAIQAEVLLSLYYLTLGRPVEGIYHSSAAVSLAISANLHLIKSPHHLVVDQPCFGVLESNFSPPAHAREECERINAFWTAVIVTNYWVAAHGSPSALPYRDTPIDTPWPHDVEDYVSIAGGMSPPTSYSTQSPEYSQHIFDNGGGTIAKFLAGLNVDGYSSLAMLAKASILLERAITFSTRYPSDHGSSPAFDSLDVLLEQFLLNLPLGLELNGTDSTRRNLMVIQTLAQVAIIRLHASRIHTSNVSRSKYLSAARAVVHLINSSDFSNWNSPHVDPILGILWTTVGEVFIGELSNIQQQQSFGVDYGVEARLAQQHHELTSCLETILSTMRTFATSSPLIDYFSSRVDVAHRAILNINSGSPAHSVGQAAY
ncbi:transcriptional activator protein acu-15 [Favolaschia claudopus]|uniref:Transcriptional activator protein acu-15 n=1 Tax=Favolaschia claudopus TaxID=2862362 RepID=A0AAV9Z2I1_9AGAR